MKVVINKCHGGFSLSEAGVRYYAKLKGIKLWVEPHDKYPSLSPTFWLVPPEERPTELEDWHNQPLEKRMENNAAFDKAELSIRDFKRDDPYLVKTVEDLGDISNGMCANLAIVEIPDDVKWEISEYDGLEHVAEVHRTWS